MADEPTFSVTMDAQQLAPPGISGDMWSVQQKPDTSEADTQAALSDQSERDFEVRCICFRDSGFDRDLRAQTTFAVGTSFFSVPEATHPGFIESGGVTFEVVLNRKREIAGFRARIRASSPYHARSQFSRALTPVVDHLAYAADTPLIVSSPSVNDEKNLVWVFGYTSPYTGKVIHPGAVTPLFELAPVYGLYREAKNVTSPFYRFFCYFKILEGIFDSLRRDLFKRAKRIGITLTKVKEVIPEHRELRLVSPQLIGRSIRDYFDTVLRKEFRDGVAHYILDSGRIISPSDNEAVAAFMNVILPAELCCRVVVDQHEAYLAELSRKAAQKASST